MWWWWLWWCWVFSEKDSLNTWRSRRESQTLTPDQGGRGGRHHPPLAVRRSSVNPPHPPSSPSPPTIRLVQKSAIVYDNGVVPAEFSATSKIPWHRKEKRGEKKAFTIWKQRGSKWKKRRVEGRGRMEGTDKAGKYRGTPGREEGESGGGEDKGGVKFPWCCSCCCCCHFGAPAPRITAFTLRLKNSPSVIIYLAGARHPGIVLPENGFHAPTILSGSYFLPVYFTHRVPLLPVISNSERSNFLSK